ncbi:MAG: alpha-L-fucosidase [Promethearchaeota archaeon]
MSGKIKEKETFLELKFGQFIHFGLYSIGKDHEWHMRMRKMSLKRYKAAFMNRFDPDPEGIEQWVLTAREMGAKYITCTSKHLDGFCLWDTGVEHPVDASYHVRDTPFHANNGTGIIEVLYDAAKKHGIRLGLYYCLLDCSCNGKKHFFSPPAFVSDDPARNAVYVDYYKAHLKELAEKFPGILLFWMDGYQFARDYTSYLDETGAYNLVMNCNPTILFANNSGTTRESVGLGHTDLLLFENMAHHGEKNHAPWPRDDPRPAEVCLTINNHWGYNEKDFAYKKPEDIAEMVKVNAGRRSNTLLNFGPKPDGYIPRDQVQLAGEIGRILKADE